MGVLFIFSWFASDGHYLSPPGHYSRFQDSQGHTLRPWFKNKTKGLERWLSSEKHRVLFQRSRVQFPATTWWLKTIYDHLHVCLKTVTVYLY